MRINHLFPLHITIKMGNKQNHNIRINNYTGLHIQIQLPINSRKIKTNQDRVKVTTTIVRIN
jgi:hypothetical protein